MLLSLRDRERSEADLPPPQEFRVLIHDGLSHGATVGMKAPPLSALEREIREEHPPARRQFRLPKSLKTRQSDQYRDSVAGFEGRWLGGFARVGETPYVVVVQTRYAAIEIVTRWLWRLVACSAAFLTIGLAVLFVGFPSLRRRM
jgi:hypothetical protein